MRRLDAFEHGILPSMRLLTLLTPQGSESQYEGTKRGGTSMASLVLHNISQELLEHLEARAASHQSSVEDEVLQVLEQAYGVPVSSPNSSFSRKLKDFLAEPRDEEWDDDPFEGIRDATSGREDNPWED
jgi:hypothetical protein